MEGGRYTVEESPYTIMSQLRSKNTTLPNDGRHNIMDKHDTDVTQSILDSRRQSNALSGISLILPTEELACNIEFGIPVRRSLTAGEAFVLLSNGKNYPNAYPLPTTCANRTEEVGAVVFEPGWESECEEGVKHSIDVAPARSKHHPDGDLSFTDTHYNDCMRPEYIAKFIRAARKTESEHFQCRKSGSQASLGHLVQTSHATKITHCSGEHDTAIPTTSSHIVPRNRTCQLEPQRNITKQRESFSLHSLHVDGISGFVKPDHAGGMIHPRHLGSHQQVAAKGVWSPKSLKAETANISDTSQNHAKLTAAHISLETREARRLKGASSSGTNETNEKSVCHDIRQPPHAHKHMPNTTKEQTNPDSCTYNKKDSRKDRKRENDTWRQKWRMDCPKRQV